MQELNICDIPNLETKLEDMEILLKLDPKHHIPNDNKTIP
jgi:hypothetical protein